MSDDLAETLAPAHATPAAPRTALCRLRALRDAAALRTVEAALSRRLTGRLRLTLPSGRATVIGPATASGEADLVLHDWRAFRQALRRGALGFAQGYIDGHWNSRDLTGLFRFFIDNRTTLRRTGAGQFRIARRDRAYHAQRANTHTGSRANIRAHYDLGNAFYAAWLDADMTYSSGLFRDPDVTLEAAQAAKYSLILDALDLAPDHRLLEIGCGWGAFAALAAARGATVTGLTLSDEQLAFARTRLQRAGLDARASIHLQDYRDTTGSFDRLVSIEMIEAVGEENWPRYFATLHDRLAPGGIGVVQAITIDEAAFEGYRRRPDFIQRYIFPGGMLPTQSHLHRHAAAAGLGCETVSLFGASYARTLAIWRTRFNAAWPRIAALGFDDGFRRMWDYYLAYCEAGFERGSIDVGVYRLTKPHASPARMCGAQPVPASVPRGSTWPTT